MCPPHCNILNCTYSVCSMHVGLQQLRWPNKIPTCLYLASAQQLQMVRDPHHINRFKHVAGYSCVNRLKLRCKDQLSLLPAACVVSDDYQKSRKRPGPGYFHSCSNTWWHLKPYSNKCWAWTFFDLSLSLHTHILWHAMSVYIFNLILICVRLHFPLCHNISVKDILKRRQ